MSSAGEEQFAMDDQLTATDGEPKKEPKISYSRDFLLSLSELDVCKKIPSGFDQSLLREGSLLLIEFEDASQDRPRIAGGFSSHSFRRNEYSSSPPTRGDLGNYSRGGRWDTRSSGRSDKDSDSHSDWDSESGKRYGQSRRPWQGPEQDGLLGSGSFPRPSGYAAGASAPKPRTSDPSQLNRSNGPYQPPRPYKAAPYSRRDTDSINDETFGSSDSTNDDSTEQERKRRAAFESMRKEQHKVLQEKQKSNVERRKDEFDISTLNGDDKIDKELATKSNALDEPVVAGNSECVKSTLQSQTSAARPLVPPGFSSATVDRNSGTKTSAHSNSTEIGNSELESKPLHQEDGRIFSATFGKLEKKSGLVEHQLGNKDSNSVDNWADKLNASTLSASIDASENTVVNLNVRLAENKIDDVSDQGSTTILDKLFGSAITPDGVGTSNLVELHDGKENDAWSPRTAQSSKFAHWFLEEADRKPLDGLSSGKSNGLLSLIVGSGESAETQVSDVNVSKNDRSSFPFQTVDASDLIPVAVGNSEQFNIFDKTEAAPPALTCEDLEQSILSELSEKTPPLLPSGQPWSTPDVGMKYQKPDIDDRASQHLLSLLLKGPGMEQTAPSPKLDIGFSDNLQTDSVETNAVNVPSSGEPLALETLFGKTFLKDLQSIGAPVSAQRGPVGSARLDGSDVSGLPFSGIEDRLHSTADMRSQYESSILASIQSVRTKSNGTEECVIGSASSQLQMDPYQFKSERGGFDASADFRLPEEEILLLGRDPINHQNLIPGRSSAKPVSLSSQSTAVDITEKLAALSSGFRDERSIAYDNNPSNNPQIQLSSSPQLHHPQMNHHVGQLFRPLDSHPSNINAQMKFMAPEGIIRHDAPLPNQQFPGNMLRPPYHHHGSGHNGFDPPAPPHPILQQMQRPGNFPPPHLLRGFPGGTPLPPQSNNHGPGFMPDINPMQGFPFAQQQHNFPGLGMQPRAPEVGGGSNHHPEAIQRLIQMELGLNSNQMRPFAAAAGRNQGSYGHELNMGFGYR